MLLFFFTAPAPTEIYTLSLHDALPISLSDAVPARHLRGAHTRSRRFLEDPLFVAIAESTSMPLARPDRKSTRLNSSHRCISYAVFCLKKKKKHTNDLAKTKIDYATNIF